jgi:2-polyprenyl-3-methyl-5-hydroxy-6-metoxy-1,4-benzoquinol methylase
MDSSTLLASISNPGSGVNGQTEHEAGDRQLCPVCGLGGAKEWLRAPDHFHGLRELYTLARCSGCSLVWQTNAPKPSEMYRHYTDAYHGLISASGQNAPHRWQARKAALAPHKQSGALLDMGCSSGAFLESLKDGPWSLYGIEMSADTAKIAEQRSGAHVFVGDVPDASFAPESFDVITCFDVLEHVYDPRQVMVKVQEWLKPGGIFYLLVPNIDSAEARVFGSYWHGLELPRHLSHFSPESLKYLAATVGLQEVSVVTRRNPAVGTSLRYVWDDIFRSVGIRRTPVAYRGEAGLVWRAGRKLVRMTFLRALLAMAPLVGGGESIHAVFRKEGEKPGAQG